ncbi:34_t:CDS:2, partial [Dentiscutata erythropus]
MTPPRKKYIFHVARTWDGKFKYPRCHFCFSKYNKLEKHVQEIHIVTKRGLSFRRQALYEKDHDNVSFKVKICSELDDITRKLKSAKEKYLLLLECGLPISNDFCRCFNSILELKQSFEGFNQRQINQTELILYGKVATVKERAAAIIKNLQDEVTKLSIKIINNNKIIELLKKDHEALLENNDDYYNLKLNEEIEDHTKQ